MTIDPDAIFFSDETTDDRLTDKDWATAVRQLGGVRRALAGRANMWMLGYDSDLRPQWVELDRLWTQTQDSIADMEDALTLYAASDTAGIAPTPTPPPTTQAIRPARSLEVWWDRDELVAEVDRRLQLHEFTAQQRDMIDLDGLHARVIEQRNLDGEVVWSPSVPWNDLGQVARLYVRHTTL